ncbi:HPr family phosphocarrier protein [Radiobacillus kanasensis]|uniref:HPr family phosphocarrier protein n=1 Tax=Radiobacillus kanasensis TaxID=2844358 RepID=UPI001E3B831A|nr:HPr family phosphocarrier protein [Radiobacillus kanasensis]UFT98444.1 HPr family phosphocarrier protein [Radiobacillus kanasensis]
MKIAELNINRDTGFARPATLLVSLTRKFKSDIFLEYHGETIEIKHSSKSIMDILSLGIEPGEQIYIKAVGTDQVKAIQSINECLYKKGLFNN